MNLFPWQQAVWQRMLNAYEQQRMAHAWLITGTSGVGKNQFAHHLAAWLLCTQKGHAACGRCRACQLFQSQQHPDFYPLSTDDDAKLNIAAARELKTQLSDSAQQTGARVIVIKSAEQLTTAAANALLKLIEEPPADVYFLLVTARPILMPITLRSRCQNLHIATPTPEETSAWLKTCGDFTEAAISKSLHLSFGSPLVALEMLSQPTLMAVQEEKAADFLAVLYEKQAALPLAAKWASLEAEDIFIAIEYVIRRVSRRAQIPQPQWFKLYEFMQHSHRQLLQISGLNQQLFWERFLLECQTMLKEKNVTSH